MAIQVTILYSEDIKRILQGVSSTLPVFIERIPENQAKPMFRGKIEIFIKT